MAELASGLQNAEAVRGSGTESRPSISPRRLRALVRKGNAARDRRDWREAARIYELVIEANPSALAIQVQLGHAHKELGDFERAGLNYHAVLELTPTDDDLHLQIGHLEKLKGRLQEAAAHYRKSAELNPKNTSAVVEYHALAANLRLPPLPAQPIDRDHGFIAAGREGTMDSDLKTFFDRVNRNSPSFENPLLRIIQGFRQAFSPLGVRRARRTSTTDLAAATALAASAERDPRLSHRGIRRQKVLFVSDSLGTPIHARGIYYYSTALVEILNNMGFEITLVVERSPDFGIRSRTLNTRSKLSSESIHFYNLTEICRYFNGDLFSFRWNYESRFQKLIQRSPFIARCTLQAHDFLSPRERLSLDYSPIRMPVVPERGLHLKKFHRFLWIDRFYSDSMSRAVNDLVPVTLNAAGFDLVIIDTPHYVRVKHIDRSRIFTVIHDLIPLSDPFMGGDWRRLFLGKLRATLASRGNLIFVSEYTQSLFHGLFPRYAKRRQLVLHPSIAKHWMERANGREPLGASSYLERVGQVRLKDRRQQIRVRADRLASNPEMRTALIEEWEAKKFPPWNRSLPHFVTVTSDEPRKNIAIFCRVAERFANKANFVIIGQVDGDRYMNYEPELYSNLHFAGYLDDSEKADVIRCAAGVIFPSFSEGFGIPILEAAVFGIPVICSNIPVFHEITGNVATYFDPHSADELAMRLNELLDNRMAYAVSALKLRELVLKRFSQQAMQQRLQHTLAGLGVRTPTQTLA